MKNDGISSNIYFSSEISVEICVSSEFLFIFRYHYWRENGGNMLGFPRKCDFSVSLGIVG